MTEKTTEAAQLETEELLLATLAEDSISSGCEKLLANFNREPTNDAVWRRAYDLALAEEEVGESPFSEFSSVPAQALINLSRKVRDLADFRIRYGLMAQAAPNGRPWFESLTGFSSPSVEAALKTYLHDRLQKGGHKLEFGTDLGCGTGRITEILAASCDRVVGIDAATPLLSLARQKTDDIEYQTGDVTKLPFEDNSLDVIAAVGLIGALGDKQETLFFSEASRVLKNDGVLIHGFWGPGNRQDLLIKLSWKNALADMIVDTVSGKYQTDHLNDHERDELLSNCGLVRRNYHYSWIPHTFLIIYEKS